MDWTRCHRECWSDSWQDAEDFQFWLTLVGREGIQNLLWGPALPLYLVWKGCLYHYERSRSQITLTSSHLPILLLMWISTKKVTLFFSHIRMMQITFSCLIPSREKGMAELSTSPLDFLLYIFRWVTRTSPHPFRISTETGPCYVASLYLRNQICPPCWHWKPQGKEKHFLTSKVFSELSRSFLFHQRWQNKAGSDRSLWTEEILRTDAAQHSMCHYPRDKFPPWFYYSLLWPHCPPSILLPVLRRESIEVQADK